MLYAPTDVQGKQSVVFGIRSNPRPDERARIHSQNDEKGRSRVPEGRRKASKSAGVVGVHAIDEP